MFHLQYLGGVVNGEIALLLHLRYSVRSADLHFADISAIFYLIVTVEEYAPNTHHAFPQSFI